MGMDISGYIEVKSDKGWEFVQALGYSRRDRKLFSILLGDVYILPGIQLPYREWFPDDSVLPFNLSGILWNWLTLAELENYDWATHFPVFNLHAYQVMKLISIQRKVSSNEVRVILNFDS